MVNRALLSSGQLAAASMAFSSDGLNLLGDWVPERSSIMILKPPAVPIPRTAGGMRTMAMPPSTW